MKLPIARRRGALTVTALAAAALVASACSSSGSPKSSQPPGTGSNSAPAATKTLTIGTSGDFPPYEFRGDNGDVIGFIPDMLKIVLPKLGYDYKYTQISFSGLPPALASGRIDMITALYDTTEREAQIAFADFAQEQDAIVVRTEDADSIKGWGDLCGKTIGAIVGSPLLPATVKSGSKSECEDKGKPAIKDATYQSDAQELRDLENGRIDAGIDGASVYGYAAKQSKGKFQVAFVAGEPAIAGWGLKKGSDLLPQIVQGLEDFLTSPDVQTVAEKWGLPSTFFLPHAKSVP
jgi:polar amino acid transport system substrate-binding protein